MPDWQQLQHFSHSLLSIDKILRHRYGPSQNARPFPTEHSMYGLFYHHVMMAKSVVGTTEDLWFHTSYCKSRGLWGRSLWYIAERDAQAHGLCWIWWWNLSVIYTFLLCWFHPQNAAHQLCYIHIWKWSDFGPPCVLRCNVFVPDVLLTVLFFTCEVEVCGNAISIPVPAFVACEVSW